MVNTYYQVRYYRILGGPPDDSTRRKVQTEPEVFAEVASLQEALATADRLHRPDIGLMAYVVRMPDGVEITGGLAF